MLLLFLQCCMEVFTVLQWFVWMLLLFLQCCMEVFTMVCMDAFAVLTVFVCRFLLLGLIDALLFYKRLYGCFCCS